VAELVGMRIASQRPDDDRVVRGAEAPVRATPAGLGDPRAGRSRADRGTAATEPGFGTFLRNRARFRRSHCCILFWLPTSSAGNTSSRPSPRSRMYCAVQRPIPFSASKRSRASAVVSAASSSRFRLPSTMARATLRITSDLLPLKPSRLSCVGEPDAMSMGRGKA